MVFFFGGGEHRRLSHGWGPKLWLNTPQKEGFWAMAETRDLETFSSYIRTLSKSFLWDEEWRHMWHGWLKPRCSSVNLLQGWIDNKLNQGFIGLVNNDSMIKYFFLMVSTNTTNNTVLSIIMIDNSQRSFIIMWFKSTIPCPKIHSPLIQLIIITEWRWERQVGL